MYYTCTIKVSATVNYEYVNAQHYQKMYSKAVLFLTLTYISYYNQLMVLDIHCNDM